MPSLSERVAGTGTTSCSSLCAPSSWQARSRSCGNDRRLGRAVLRQHRRAPSRTRGALGGRAMFGFPAVGGVRDGPVVRYVLIRQQKTMLGEATATTTPRVHQLQEVLDGAGFPTRISANIDGWMLGHAAFVVPIGFALYRVGTDAARLAADPRHRGVDGAGHPGGLQGVGCLRQRRDPRKPSDALPPSADGFHRPYWRRVFAGPSGELWFAAHSRAAPEEMQALADELQSSSSVASAGRLRTSTISFPLLRPDRSSP